MVRERSCSWWRLDATGKDVRSIPISELDLILTFDVGPPGPGRTALHRAMLERFSRAGFSE